MHHYTKTVGFDGIVTSFVNGTPWEAESN